MTVAILSILALILAGIVIVLILLLTIGAASIRSIARAVAAFASDETRIPINLPARGWMGIRALSIAFAQMAGKVDEIRKRDAEISRIKSDFITTAAHQLQTPITGIRWAVEGLKKTTLAPEQIELLTNIESSSAVLAEVVHTFLEVSNIESGNYTYKFEAVDPIALVTTLAQSLQPTFAAANINFNMVPPQAALPQVRADQERIKQALTTLLENALRYTPAGGTVTISLELGPRLVFIHIGDTGIGIPEGDHNNIFESFYRGGNAATHVTGGIGLDLYIARAIAIAHGGQILFKNNAGAGTTFTLSIPAI